RRERPSREKNAPKKNLTAYMFFTKHLYNNLDVPFKDRACQVAQKWKELTDDQKAIYYEKAVADKKRYDQE
ncbi:hypothetical protein ROZALSC1DRAFT_3001, partial [Rozella allomycis CSF55]